MSTKYDDNIKYEVMNMLKEGEAVSDIMVATQVPRSTIYCWRKELNLPSDPKPTQAVTNEQTDLIQALTDRVAALEGQVDRQTEKLLECFKYVTRKLKEEAKEEEWRESERMSQPGYDPNKPTFVFGKKQ